MIPIAYNLRNLTVRKTTSIATAAGLALVVAVVASALMLLEGINRTLVSSGKDDVAIVIRKGSDAELASGIEEPQVGVILNTAGVARNQAGAPLGVGEVSVVIILDKVGTEGVANVQVRGVPDNVLQFRQNVKITEGRNFQPGSDEAIIGQSIRGRFKGIELGQSVELRKNRPLKIVGVFEDGGTSFESEIWADLNTVRAAFGREGLVSSVRVKLESPSMFDAFEATIEGDKQLGLEAIREPDYYAKQSQETSIFIGAVAVLIAVFFSIGAMIGATITMHAAVANRQREIGTLRALGFSRFSILISFLFESVALSFFGGLIGLGLSLFTKFIRFPTMNFGSWSEVVFTFQPTPGIFGFSLMVAVIMGVFGGFFPAYKAAKMSPLAAMRA